MITLEQKPIAEIIEALRGKQKLIIIGCGACATACKAGGEEEVKTMKQILTNQGFDIISTLVIDEACHIPLSQKELRKISSQIKQADACLVLTCGSGIQTISTSLPDKPVISGTNSLFLGSVKRIGDFTEFCSLCGECVLNITGGICPVTRCPKGMLNGPCGGMENGKCEQNQERECVWVAIYNNLKELGKLEKISAIIPPKDHSRKTKPAALTIKNKAQ